MSRESNEVQDMLLKLRLEAGRELVDRIVDVLEALNKRLDGLEGAIEWAHQKIDEAVEKRD